MPARSVTILRMLGAALIASAMFACSPQPSVTTPTVADRVLIEKGKRTLQLMNNGRVLRTYHVALGQNPVGHKFEQGDQRTPEGIYTIDLRRPESRFNLALRISYPNDRDRQIAAARGVDPGGEIYIHGQPYNGVHPARLENGPDWTDGCIALSNREMQEIWAMVPLGTPVEIRP